MSEERRRSPRIQMALEVELRFSEPDEVLASLTADVSLHGLFFCTDADVPVGTPVRVELVVAEQTTAIRGRVVRVADASSPPRGLGIEYVELDEETRRRIKVLTGGT